MTGLQMDPATAEAADAQFRSLHVGQDADRAVELFLQFADHGEAGGVVLVRAVQKFSRNTSAPAWNSRAMISGVELAGPSVAMILVRRRRRIFGRLAMGAASRRSGRVYAS